MLLIFSLECSTRGPVVQWHLQDPWCFFHKVHEVRVWLQRKHCWFRVLRLAILQDINQYNEQVTKHTHKCGLHGPVFRIRLYELRKYLIIVCK
jgi:hypothetical protein